MCVFSDTLRGSEPDFQIHTFYDFYWTEAVCWMVLVFLIKQPRVNPANSVYQRVYPYGGVNSDLTYSMLEPLLNSGSNLVGL